MITSFQNKRIAGVLTVLPQNEIPFEDEIENYTFQPKQTLRLKKIMGYKKHCIAADSTATSDLCVVGLKHILKHNYLKPEDIGALIVLTITPDHFVPHTSNIIQARCNLSTNILCMDIVQGCAGFLLGLMQGFLLLEHMADKKVVLINADVLSHKISKQDRNSYPLCGDAATITILENSPSNEKIWCNIYMDGKRGDALKIPAGGSRLPCGPKTAIKHDAGDGNLRSLNNMCMDGEAVFQFVQRDVPPLIEETLVYAGIKKEEIEWYLFHQPNRFMLRKLAEKLEIPYEKVPMDIVENFGNPSGASIPLLITADLSSQMMTKKSLCCLSAFGGGLTWGAMIMHLGGMDFCEMLHSNL
ncbi:ketoacyl-ACP synthase III [Clostridium sp. AF18-27]|uniref:ketoacyl-ACP synthase III n=1 Tax=Enterocloster lavalensis TaxID=460384 RepID=UPI000E4A2C80|nr:ketoacyl-ACP synthase III [Enterocloster lavalensis]RHR51858.1 ketoacyl-ACP synthase III [Clostridium sp. AF18-27]